MEKTEILEIFEKEFKQMRKDLKFKATLEELDTVFFLRDYILNGGHFRYNLSRALSHRLMDTFGSWNSYLHSLVVPNPGSLINMSESEMFNKEEKKAIMKLMTQTLVFTSRNSVNGLTKNDDGKFFDDTLKFWNKILQPELVKIMKKVNTGWIKKSKD